MAPGRPVDRATPGRFLEPTPRPAAKQRLEKIAESTTAEIGKAAEPATAESTAIREPELTFPARRRPEFLARLPVCAKCFTVSA